MHLVARTQEVDQEEQQPAGPAPKPAAAPKAATPKAAAKSAAAATAAVPSSGNTPEQLSNLMAALAKKRPPAAGGAGGSGASVYARAVAAGGVAQLLADSSFGWACLAPGLASLRTPGGGDGWAAARLCLLGWAEEGEGGVRSTLVTEALAE